MSRLSQTTSHPESEEAVLSLSGRALYLWKPDTETGFILCLQNGHYTLAGKTMSMNDRM